MIFRKNLNFSEKIFEAAPEECNAIVDRVDAEISIMKALKISRNILKRGDKKQFDLAIYLTPLRNKSEVDGSGTIRKKEAKKVIQ